MFKNPKSVMTFERDFVRESDVSSSNLWRNATIAAAMFLGLMAIVAVTFYALANIAPII